MDENVPHGRGYEHAWVLTPFGGQGENELLYTCARCAAARLVERDPDGPPDGDRQ